MESGANGESMEKLKGLRITSLDDDEEEEPQKIVAGEYEDDDEDDEEEQEPVTLGFLEKPKNRWSLLRHLFPSEAGGPPVYAPVDEKESTFRGTLFVFMCPSMACLLRDQHSPEKPCRSVKVFSCQLSRSIPFYSSVPPKCNVKDKPCGPGVSLCNWCGTWKGDKVCSGCRGVHYFSQKHQVTHWRSGHKVECQQLNLSSPSSDSNPTNGETALTE